MTRTLPAILLAVCLVFALAVSAGSRASAAGTISDVSVDNRFPDSLVFKATVSADADLARIELRYRALPDGTNAHGELEFSPGKTATVEFELKVNDPPRAYFPGGTTIQYYWWAEDAAGNVFQTEPVDYFFLDDRFEWEPVAAGNLTVYFHSGSRSYAENLAQLGNDGLARTGALLGVTVPFPVRVFLYSDPEEMRPALQTRSATYGELVTTGGVRVTSDLVFVAKGFEDNEDTLRHELAHVVTKVAGEGAFGDIPSWLDEGTAVYSQNEPGSGYEGAIEDAIDGDRVLSLRAIEAAPDNPSDVNVFYGQSWSIVKFLVDSFGQEKYAALFAEFKKGSTIDGAFTTVYGMNIDAIENAWRAANGLPERAASTATATPEGTSTPAATLTPFSANPGTPVASTTTQPNVTNPVPAATDDGTNMGILVALAVAGVALLVLLFAGGMAMRRRGGTPGPQ